MLRTLLLICVAVCMIAGGYFLGVDTPSADAQQVGWVLIAIGLAILALLGGYHWVRYRKNKANQAKAGAVTGTPKVGGSGAMPSRVPPQPAQAAAAPRRRIQPPAAPAAEIDAEALAALIADPHSPVVKAIWGLFGQQFMDLHRRIDISERADELMEEDEDLTRKDAVERATREADPTSMPQWVIDALIEACGDHFLADWLKAQDSATLKLCDLSREKVDNVLGRLDDNVLGRLDDDVARRIGNGMRVYGDTWTHSSGAIYLAVKAMYMLKDGVGKTAWENILKLKAHEWSAASIFAGLTDDEVDALYERFEDGEVLDGFDASQMEMVEELFPQPEGIAAPVAEPQEETDAVKAAVIKMLRDMSGPFATYGDKLARGEDANVSASHKRTLRTNLPNVLKGFNLTYAKAVEVCGWLSLDVAKTFPDLSPDGDLGDDLSLIREALDPDGSGDDDDRIKVPAYLRPVPTDRDVVAFICTALSEVGLNERASGVSNGDTEVAIPPNKWDAFRAAFGKAMAEQAPLTQAEQAEIRKVLVSADELLPDYMANELTARLTRIGDALRRGDGE